MNNYGIHKLWNFGRDLKKRFSSWPEVVFNDDWDDFLDRHEITDDQLHLIKQGFEGKKIEARTDGIFPFGIHKGKPMNKIPIEYLVWCSEQSWLDRWPSVWDYCNKRKQDIQKHQSEFEEGLDILKSIKL